MTNILNNTVKRVLSGELVGGEEQKMMAHAIVDMEKHDAAHHGQTVSHTHNMVEHTMDATKAFAAAAHAEHVMVLDSPHHGF